MYSHKPLQFRIFLHLLWSLLEDTCWSDVDHAIIPSATALIAHQLLTTFLWQVTTQSTVCEKAISFSFQFKYTIPRLYCNEAHHPFPISEELPVEAKLKGVTQRSKNTYPNSSLTSHEENWVFLLLNLTLVSTKM